MIPAPTNEIDIVAELPEIAGDCFDDLQYPDRVPDGLQLKTVSTARNVEALLDYCGLVACHNQMNMENMLVRTDGSVVADSLEVIRSMLISMSQLTGLPKSAIDDHLGAICERTSFHPVRKWLDDGDGWDGQKRVDAVINCLKTKDPTLTSIVIRKWLIGCVACLYEPEFRSKLIPVLQGDQSWRKSAFIERIAKVIDGAFLEGAELNPDNKDSVLSCMKSWIVELGELERSTKNSQGSLKAFITKGVDTVRPPYGRTDVKKPRQTNFIASVNGDSFLKDDTGSARYAVLVMTDAPDMDTLNDLLGWNWNEGKLRLVNPDNLRQFWLEIKADYDAGNGWMLTDEELKRTTSINAEFQDKGCWYQWVYERFAGGGDSSAGEWLPSADICARYDIGRKNTAPLGKALTLLVKEGHIKMKKGSGNKTLYFVNPKADEYMSDEALNDSSDDALAFFK